MTALGDFVTIVGPAGVIGGIVSGSVNHVLKSWGERRTTQAQARYLALRVAIALERFAGDCLDLIAEINMGTELRRDPSSQPTNLPTLAEYPADDLG